MTPPSAVEPAPSAVHSEAVPPIGEARGGQGPFAVRSLLLGGLAVLLFGTLFAPLFRQLAAIWSVDDNYSHGFLVPLISAYLGWELLQRQGQPTAGSIKGGLLWIGIGALFHAWALVIGWPAVDFVSVGTILYGIAVLVGGRRWANGLSFPILFLFFMFPLPPVLIDAVAIWLQGTVSTAAAFVLSLFAPVVQTGNVLTVSGRTLEVGEACSGLRQLIAFVALGLLVAHRSPRSVVFKTAIVLAAVPVAIVANLLRVLLMSFLVVNYGPAWISEREILALGISYHTAWGLLTMLVGLGLFLGVRWWLMQAFPRPTDEGMAEAAAPSFTESVVQALRAVASPSLARPFAVACSCLAVALTVHLALSAHLEAASSTAATGLERPLTGFPVSLGAWSGQEETPTSATLPYFNAADDRLSRVYRPQPGAAGADPLPEGLECRLFMVHFKDGQDRRHHPRICYGVAGFKEDLSQHQELEMDGGLGKVQRFCFTRGDARSYVYYWHYTLEPDEAEHLSPLQTIHQAVGVRRPSLTIQVFTNAQVPEHLDKVAEFVREADRRLQGHLPRNARRGGGLLPVKYVP